MAISTDVNAHLIEHGDDDHVKLQVSLQLVGVPHGSFCAEIDTHAYERPVVVGSTDALGVNMADRDTLALALYRRLAGYFGSGPTGGTIRSIRWLEPDIAPWLRTSVYFPACHRLIRCFGRHVDSVAPPRIFAPVTESVEE